MGAMSEKEILNIRNLTQEQNFDKSVQTFRGHKVGKTLIRCHFSPLGLTDRRYIHTASYCGKVFLYDILSSTTKHLDIQDEKNQYTAGTYCILNDMEQSCVRDDAAWHPTKMAIITTNLKGQLFKWFNNNLYFEELEDLEKQNQIEDESNQESSGRRQSQFENYRWDYEGEDQSKDDDKKFEEEEDYDEDYDEDDDKNNEDEDTNGEHDHNEELENEDMDQNKESSENYKNDNQDSNGQNFQDEEVSNS
ncbi:hypothetical protein ABPG72_002831 [Tetrahymena utriculariae]